MAGPCPLRSINTGAITTPQFLESFQRVWLDSRVPRPEPRRKTLPRRIGLAVSGGADSMALAYLCRQWEKTHRQDDVSVMAFVVDHRARAESAREAAKVTTWLAQMGIRTRILKVSWSQGTLSRTPSQVSAFETHARRLRFQALGTACRDNQIETLLMGHHQDDNVETALWRLCSGARGAGLAGIPSVNPIPECHGLFGVAESGSSVTLHSTSPAYRPGTSNQSGRSSAFRQVPMSAGGILICRPLLSFPKASFLATCEKNNVPYVSDPTNFDTTLTPRNTIRNLLSSDRLPQALQTPSVLSLVTKSQELVRDTADLSNEFLQQCKILDLNLATGTMTVQFPSTPPTSIPQIAPSKLHLVQATTLRRITDLLSPSPGNHYPVRSFAEFTSDVFPIADVPLERRMGFTVGGVMFEPVARPRGQALLDGFHAPRSSSTTTVDDVPHPDTSNAHTSPPNPSDSNIWFLSRPPFMRNRLPTHNFNVSFPPPKPPSPAQKQMKHHKARVRTHPPPPKPSPPKITTPWILWDDRFWIRVTIGIRRHRCRGRKPPPYPLTDQSLPILIRPLQKSDLQLIRQISYHDVRNTRTNVTPPSSSTATMAQDIKRNEPLNQFLKRLAKEAPRQSRFTLPVVVIPKGFDGLEDALPLCLPTMEQWVPGARAVMKSRPILKRIKVEVEWMYKKVDTEPLELMGGVEKVEEGHFSS